MDVSIQTRTSALLCFYRRQPPGHNPGGELIEWRPGNGRSGAFMRRREMEPQQKNTQCQRKQQEASQKLVDVAEFGYLPCVWAGERVLY